MKQKEPKVIYDGFWASVLQLN